MPFDALFPPDAERLLALAAPHEPIMLRATADLGRDQRFAPTHVAATPARVVVIQEGRIHRSLPLGSVAGAAIDELVGGGRLVVETAEGAIALCYFSRTLTAEFAAAARAIAALAKGSQALLPELECTHCARCQSPLPERGTSCPRCVSRSAIILRVLALARPRSTTVLLMAMTLLVVAAQMIPPLAYRQITDRVIGDHRLGLLLPWIGAILASLLATSALRMVANVLATRLATSVCFGLQNRLHEHLTRLKLSWHGKRDAGELVGRLMSDTRDLEAFLREGMPFLLVNVLSLVSIAGILVCLNARLALIAFLPIPLLLLSGLWFWNRLLPLYQRWSSRRGRIHGIFSESLRGLRAVKLLGQERRRAALFTEANDKALAVSLAAERAFFTFFEGLSAVMQLGTLGVWYMGARGVIASGGHDPSLGDIMAFVGYTAMFYAPLQWFAVALRWMTAACAGAERVFGVLDLEPEAYREAPGLPEAAASTAVPRLMGEIELKEVSFSYERGKEILHGISLRVRPGEMLGLVGRSGAGKSTIIGLLTRFFDPDHGRIRIDGRDLQDLPLEAYRRDLGVVMQDPYLFQGSILENLRYGKPEASFAAVVEAAKAAHCHEFILAKEDGYDTVIGDGGTELSGGERQRLSIARAILGDPRILILDEATSAVDAQTEKAIQEAIGRLVRGRTTIAIAHRLSTLRDATRLAVIDGGRVVEEGTHEELLAKPDGHFARLVRLQAEANRVKSTHMMELT